MIWLENPDYPWKETSTSRENKGWLARKGVLWRVSYYQMKEQAFGAKSPVIICRCIYSPIVLHCLNQKIIMVLIPKKLDSKTLRTARRLLRSSSSVCSFSNKETEDQKCDLLSVTRSCAPFEPLCFSSNCTKRKLFSKWC